jgi:hypothetical protein
LKDPHEDQTVTVDSHAAGLPLFAPNASALPHELKAKSKQGPWIATLVALGLVVFVLVLSLARHPGGASAAPALLIVTAPLVVLFAIVAALNARRPVYVLYPDRIEVRTLFGAHALARADIAGVSQVRKTRSGSYFCIVARPDRGDGMRLDGRLRDDPAVAAWLEGAPDPQVTAVAEDRAQVLADLRYGPTPEAREARLQLVRIVVIGFSVACVAAALWIFVAPLDRMALAIAALATALAAALSGAAGGLVIWRPVRRARPSIAAGALPALALALKALTVKMLHAEPLVWAGCGLGVAALVFVAQRPSPWGTRAQSAVVAGVVGFVAAYGLGVAIDAGLDAAPAQTYVATVADMWVHHGRSTSYELRLTPWGGDGARTVSVSRELYGQLRVGAPVCPVRHPGALALAWYQLAPCATGAWSRGPG